MKRVLISKLAQYVGKEVTVCGWVLRVRVLSKVVFLILKDRSGLVQVVLKPELISGLDVSNQSVVEIQGTVVQDKQVLAGHEVHASAISLISKAKSLPFTLTDPNFPVNLDTMLNNRILSLRHDKINPIFSIQAQLVQGFQQFLNNEGFLQVFTPKIVASGTEGGSELFSVQYFDQQAYLAQSPQFYKQMLVAAGYERIYEVGQVYRAEPHATKRHINEYVSLDLEVGFITDETEVMALETRLLRHMFAVVEKTCHKQLQQLGIVVPKIPEIPVIPLKRAHQLLEEKYGKSGLAMDLDPEGERLIGKYVLQEFGSEFVFITEYPWEKRPMYTMPTANGLTRSFDLLFRGLEITTGGQRIHDYQQLVANMRRKGLLVEDFTSYLEVFSLGMPPHGGLAIGLERLTKQLLGLDNVREATLFPRDRYRLAP